MKIEGKEIPIRDLKKTKENFFKLIVYKMTRRFQHPTYFLSDEVYLVNHYDRASKTYSISPVDDLNKEEFVKDNRKIFVGFTH